MAIWLIRSLAALCDPKRAYRMRSIRLKALSLSGNIAVGSPLRALLRIDGIGLQTVLHLTNPVSVTFDHLVSVVLQNSSDRLEYCGGGYHDGDARSERLMRWKLWGDV